MPSDDPMYTTPPTTAGLELTTMSPSCACQSSVMNFAFDALRTFSKGWTPSWRSSYLNCGQSVRTVNGACPVEPEVSPVAEKVCDPGRASRGTLPSAEKPPCPSAVV